MKRQDTIQQSSLDEMLRTLRVTDQVGEHEEAEGLNPGQVSTGGPADDSTAAQHVLTQPPQIPAGQSWTQASQQMKKVKMLPRLLPHSSHGSLFHLRAQEEQASMQRQVLASDGTQQELLLNSMRQCQLIGEQNEIIREQTSVLRDLSQHLEAANSFHTTIAKGIGQIEMYSNRMNATLSNLVLLNRGMVSEMIKAQETNAKNLESFAALLEKQEIAHKPTGKKPLGGVGAPSVASSVVGSDAHASGSSNARRPVTQLRGAASVKIPKLKR
ncbi:uncharacterized protein [Ambystoma mexicanum]|uniref:uncharacterized protein n=1 Tax=Ambystoma mexicanum TaxID=8296 RepID=UPI0037E8EFEA